MTSDWHIEIDKFLDETEKDTFMHLKNIKNELNVAGIAFDNRFREHFLQILNNR